MVHRLLAGEQHWSMFDYHHRFAKSIDAMGLSPKCAVLGCEFGANRIGYSKNYQIPFDPPSTKQYMIDLLFSLENIDVMTHPASPTELLGLAPINDAGQINELIFALFFNIGCDWGSGLAGVNLFDSIQLPDQVSYFRFLSYQKLYSFPSQMMT